MNQRLSVSLRTTMAPGCLHRSQMEAIAASLVVEMPCGVRMVQYSPTAPPDTTLPWQQTDECGGAPVGVVKHFTKGAWA